jgi:hypothetical protein
MLENKAGFWLMKYLHGRWHEVILQQLNVSMTIHVAIYLHQMSATAISNATPKHHTNTIFRPTHLHALWLVTFVGLTPDNHTTVTFKQCDTKFVGKNNMTPVLPYGPSLNDVGPMHPCIPDPGVGKWLPFCNTPPEITSMQSENKNIVL